MTTPERDGANLTVLPPKLPKSIDYCSSSHATCHCESAFRGATKQSRFSPIVSDGDGTRRSHDRLEGHFPARSSRRWMQVRFVPYHTSFNQLRHPLRLTISCLGQKFPKHR